MEVVTGTVRHFGGPGRTLPELLAGWLRGGGKAPDWPQLTPGTCWFTSLGRVAIDLVCAQWRLGNGDEVLVPAYNCGSEVDPYLRHGCRPVLYRTDGELRIDLEDLRRRATARTRVVHVTHYFGWPQDLEGLRAWCREREVLLLEDCALALFSAGPDRVPVGSVGDAAVFSITKTLPVPDGGILALRQPPRDGLASLHRPSSARVARRVLPLLKARFLARAERLGVFDLARRLVARNRPAPESPAAGTVPDMPASYYFDDALRNRGMSRMSHGLIQRTDPGAVVAQRRENYGALAQGLAGCPGIRILHEDLPAGVCPLVFPVLVEDRGPWLRGLHARGIPAIAWWSGYHRGLDFGPFPEARRLKDHLLALPVHQDLGPAHMTGIVAHVRSLAATC